MPLLIPALTILIVAGALICFRVLRLCRRRLPGKAEYALRHARHFKGGMLCCHACGNTDIGVDPKHSSTSYRVHVCRHCDTPLWRDKIAQ